MEPIPRKLYEVIPTKLYFTVHTSQEMTFSEINRDKSIFFFSSYAQESYQPFAADFGPVDLGVVHNFCEFMHNYVFHPRLQNRKIVYYTSEDSDHRTNCAFLIAAYLIVDFGLTPNQAWAPFAKMPKMSFASYIDATGIQPNYFLSVLACLQGLAKGISMGWYNKTTFKSEEYYGTATNFDMTVVTPKFVAFKGPVCATEASKRSRDEWTCPPEHFTQEFKDLDVEAVVRLNSSQDYSSSSFKKEGFKHYECFFEDCTHPSNDIVQKFLTIAESSSRRVAVHCRAGLGRTGTLIAIYMMKHHGFTASECIGWLRIVRPGSILGDQQHYLHWAEKNLIGALLSGSGKSVPEFRGNIVPDEARRMGEQIALSSSGRVARLVSGQMLW